jgi:hypothetical protein
MIIERRFGLIFSVQPYLGKVREVCLRSAPAFGGGENVLSFFLDGRSGRKDHQRFATT